MKKIFKRSWVVFFFLLSANLSENKRQNNTVQDKKLESGIHWMSLDEASKEAKKSGKKIIIDVYTNWCGWCKIMDQKTFSDAQVIQYIQQKYLAVKLNAESQDTLIYQGMKFGFNPEKRANQLAYLLLNGQMSYPTTVIMNENSEILTPIKGFIEPAIMLKVLKYYGENFYQTTTWEDFQK